MKGGGDKRARMDLKMGSSVRRRLLMRRMPAPTNTGRSPTKVGLGSRRKRGTPSTFRGCNGAWLGAQYIPSFRYSAHSELSIAT